MAAGQELFESFVRDHGGRLTPQRAFIVREFLSLRGHYDVQQLHDHFRRLGRQIDPSTIFRTLKLLVQAGIASERQFANGKTKFEKNSAHHDHLICLRCGKIVEFSSDKLERLQERIINQFGFEMTYHKFEVYGLCEPCRRKAAGTKQGRK